MLFSIARLKIFSTKFLSSLKAAKTRNLDNIKVKNVKVAGIIGDIAE